MLDTIFHMTLRHMTLYMHRCYGGHFIQNTLPEHL